MNKTVDAWNEGHKNLRVVQEYLQAIERGAPFEEVGAFFAPDVVQREFPNQLVPQGATRGLQELAEAAARGRKVVTSQRYEVQSAIAVGDRVAIEARWIGVLAVPFFFRRVIADAWHKVRGGASSAPDARPTGEENDSSQ